MNTECNVERPRLTAWIRALRAKDAISVAGRLKQRLRHKCFNRQIFNGAEMFHISREQRQPMLLRGSGN